MKSETPLTKEQEIELYLKRMLSNRKNRRRLAKIDKQLKNWSVMKVYYQPINKPIDLGINKFKKLARQRLEKPYKTVLEYKKEMHIAFDNFTQGGGENGTRQED